MSTADRWKEISEIYAAALAYPEAERAAFLTDACAGDQGLRQELASLLDCHIDAQHLMAVPAMRLIADRLAGETSSLIGRQLGPYRIDAPLASGGMGEVYRATDTRLHRAVALKILPPYLRESLALRRRFEQEAQAVAALRHPHVCVLHDIGRADDIDFLVMELLDGETMADRLTRGPLPLGEALRHAIDIADALVTTHRHGIVHRDLKPGNVMLTQTGAKLLDFGLAKLSYAGDSDVAAAASSDFPAASVRDLGTSTAGTLRYMTPEQLDRKDVDHRSDIFAFGVLLYEMLTARKAFDGPDPASLGRAIREHEPAALPPDITIAAPGLDPLIRKCLQKHPPRRWQETQSMADGLRQVAGASITRRRLDGWRPRSLVAVAFAIVATVTVGWLASGSNKPVFTFDFEPVQFTSTGDAADPALSSDGAFVAYVRGGSLWVAPVTEPDSATQIAMRTSGAITRPTVTPDGRSINFLEDGDLWRVPMHGGPPTKVLEQVSGAVGYAPDGRQLAFIRNTAGRSAVMISRIDGSGARELITRSGPSGFGALPGAVYGGPRWAPNGRVLAVPHFEFVPSEVTDGTRRAGVVFLDPATGRVLNEGPDLLYAGLLGAEWIDDHSLLLTYGAQSGPPVQFWLLSYPGGTLSRLQNDIVDWVRLSFSADRRVLATLRSEFRSSIWVDGVEAVGLSSSGPVGNSLEWTDRDVVHSATTVGRPTFLARHVLGRSGSQEFVPNAHSVFANLQDGSFAFISDGPLWKVDRSGGHREPLMSILGLGARPAIFGRTVLFRRSDGTLARADVGGGAPVTIRGVAATGGPDISPDGRFMAFSSIDSQEQSVVIVCELPDCTNRRIASVPALGRPSAFVLQVFWRNVRFTPTGDVSYLDRDRTNVWVLPRTGGRPYTITRFAADRRISDFAWSHDGRLAVSRYVWTNDVVLFKRKVGE